MTKKSYITLCIVGILYIIMASTAILSPHGNNFSSATPSNATNDIVPGMNDQFAGIDSKIVITNKTSTEIEIDLKSMPALAGRPLEYTDSDDETTTFTAVKMSRVITFSSLAVGESIILTDGLDKTYTISADDFTAKDNAYLAYADENNQPLSNEYGYFCLLVLEGESAGLYKDIVKISLG